MPSLLYLVPHSFLRDPYLQSQVGGPLRLLASEGYELHLLTLEQDASDLQAPFYRDLDSRGIHLHMHTGSRIKGMLWAMNQLRQLTVDRIYVREIYGALLTSAAGRIGRMVYDIRGAVPEEFLFSGGSSTSLKYHWYRTLFHLFSRLAPRLLCVSHPLALYLEERIGRKATVIPCCVDDLPPQADVVSLRSDLGLGGKLVLCYSGGTAAWQQIDQVLTLFAMLAETEPDLDFLVLSNHEDYFRQAVASSYPALAGRLSPRKVPQSEVARYLQAADIGVLLREDHVVNRVASPIKGAEYLAAGLALLVSPGIGDLSDDVKAADCGLLWRPGDDIESVRHFLRAVAEQRPAYYRRARDLANRRYVWRSHLTTLKEVLR